MRPSTIEQRRRLYLLARVIIARHYRRPLTLDEVARALASSPRQITRAYAQFGEVTFREELLTRRLNVGAQLLIEQPAIPVRDVARLVGFRQAPHFAKAFRARYGLTPAAFRAEGRAYARGAQAQSREASSPRCAARLPAGGAPVPSVSCEAGYRAPPATRPVPLRAVAGASASRPRGPAAR
jgi:AraC family transcriptional regulator, regulatory protein of adaptative response / methylphosphotriester-DNA alkyltransferase methyltransferase